MYADRYAGPARFNPAGLLAAIGINAAVIAALLVAAPHIAPTLTRDPIIIYDVPLKPPPEPEPKPEPLPRASTKPASVDRPTPIVPVSSNSNNEFVHVDAPPGNVEVTGSPGGTGTAPAAEPPAPTPAPPLIVAPGVDPAHVRDLQPPYPPSERRAGEEGRVTVRVLIGTDGRVKQVERVAAASDAFFRATERQALSRWRFRPGTRDGVPQEAWRTMTVTFVMQDE